MENAIQADSTAQKKASVIATIGSFALSILINVIIPFLIFWALKQYTTASDYLALVISGVPSLLDSIVGIIRRRRIDLLAGLNLSALVVTIIITTLGGSPKIYLVRESFFTVAIGLAYLISLPFPRPLAFYFSRYFATGNHPENIPWFDSLWQYPQFRKTMYVTTVVWGIGFLLEAAIRTILVFMLSIEQFLLISPFVFYGFLGGILLWTFLYSQQGRKRANQIREQMTAEKNEAASSTAS